MTQPAVYLIHRPQAAAVPLVFDSPHSSSVLPPDFGHAVTDIALREAEDSYVNELYAAAPQFGASLLEANFARTYIDPNRAPGDVDLDLLDGPWPFAYAPSGKARIGKALIWRTLDDGQPIYAGRLSVQAVKHRIDHYLLPYQSALKGLLDEAHARHQRVYHVNCHSMQAVGGKMGQGGAGVPRAEVVLGDRDGTSCAPAFTELVREFFAGRGYDVKVNDPYKGVELVRAFADPARERHSLQIELNKRLYLQDNSIARSSNFMQLKRDLTDLIAMLARYASSAT